MRYFAALALLIASTALHADPRFQALWENYGRAQGLPAGQVASFAQDARGYLYAGTDRGLTRFDGRKFSELLTEPKLPLEAVELLRFDERGKLWASVNGFGVCVIDQLEQKIARSRCLSEAAQDARHKLPDNQVFTLESWRGKMWLAVYGHGILEVDIDSLTLGKLHTFPDNRLLSSAIWQKSLLVGALDGTLYRFDPHSGVREVAKLDAAANLIVDAGERAFVTLLRGNELIEIDSRMLLVKHSIVDAKSISSFTLHRGKLVLATDTGLILGYPGDLGGGWQPLKSFGNAPGAMPEGRINTVFFDQQNGLWVGSRTAGAGRLNDINSPLTWLLRGDGGLPTNTVNAADMADDGRLWIATSTRGALAFYPDGTQSSLPIDARDGIPTKNIRAVRTRAETVWIGHQLGLTQHRPNAQSERFSHWQSDAELGLVDQIEPTQDGGAWISVGFSRLVKLDAGLIERDRIKAPGESTVIEQFLVTDSIVTTDQPPIVERAKESIWWADNAGFHVRISRDDPVQTLSNEQGLGVTRCPKSGHVWFIGRQSLLAIDPQTLAVQARRSYTTEASSDIGGLWCGPDDTLYFSGNSGLWRWPLLQAKPSRIDTFENAAEMSERPLQAADNVLLVAGPRGLLRVDLANLRNTSSDSGPFALHITERPAAKLGWRQNAASISADALSMHSPMLTQYQFIAKSGAQLLEASAWSNQHQHRFERLPAGNIRFEVNAKNAAGTLVSSPAILTSVEQVPWRRPSAMALLFALAGIAAHSIYRVRLNRHRREAALREAELLAVQKSELAVARTESLSVIAHEMRNLLNGVGTSTQMLRRSPDSELAPQWLSRVENATEGLARLLDDALDFTKIATGHSAIQPRNTDVQQLIIDCVEAHRPAAQIKSLCLECGVAVQTPMRVLDPVRFRQIASNLINNAIKFTDDGSVLVRLSDALLASNQSPTLVLEVEDTGIGIPAHAKLRIFEPYARLNSERQGTGLGLAITAELAKACGGAIAVLPGTTGKGSLFRLTLPAPMPSIETTENLPIAQPDASQAATSAAAIESINGVEPAATALTTHCPILVIEQGNEVSTVLQNYGFTAFHCHSAFDALEVAQNSAFAAVLIDLGMADQDSFDVAQTLRLLPPFQHLPMLAFSESADPKTLAHCQQIGISMLLEKPFDGAQINAALYEHLRINAPS